MSTTSGKFVNVFHISHVTGEADAIALAWDTECTVPYANCLVSQVTLDNIVVTELSTHEQYTKAIAQAGSITADMLPPQAAAVISWRTTKAGRAFRGRTYVPGLSEGAQNNGTINGSHLNLMNALAAALHTDWPNNFSGSHVIYHREAGTYDVITSWLLRATIYTQRRRTLGVGA
jgi:hypothetical protein